ncbi:MAG TPA: hypothetical protein VHK27_11040 [Gammaproteobacteria bacterium]|nr:hypothetical protein [Gammaproteobacteria bacterium]
MSLVYDARADQSSVVVLNAHAPDAGPVGGVVRSSHSVHLTRQLDCAVVASPAHA